MSSSIQVRFIKLLGGNSCLTAMNLLRDIVIASAFGVAASTDMLFLALSFPIFVVTVSSNVFRNILVPLLTKRLVSNSNEYENIASRINYLFLKYSLAFALIIAGVSACIYVGFAVDEKTALFLKIMILILPMYVLSSFQELNLGILQVRNSYFLPAMLRIGMPLGIIVAVFFIADYAQIYAVPIGGFFGTAISFLLVIKILHGLKIMPARRAPPLDVDNFTYIRTNFFALSIGTAITYVNPVVDQWAASFLNDGDVSSIGYANRLIVGLSSLIAGSIAPVILSAYSHYVAENKTAEISIFFNAGTKLFFGIGTCMMVAVWMFSGIIVDLVYGYGKFSESDIYRVSVLMNYYAGQFPLLFASTLSYTLISAVSRNAFFIRMGALIFLINLVGNILLMRAIGVYGIALSTVIVYASSLLIMNMYLIRNQFVSLLTDTIPVIGFFSLCALFIGVSIKEEWFGAFAGNALIAANIMIFLAFVCAVMYSCKSDLKIIFLSGSK